MNWYTLLIPLAGTSLGAAMVFFMKRHIGKKTENALLGFAAGVMVAASVWSLLIPAIDMAEEQGVAGWLPAVVGFLGGIAFLLLMDSVVPHLHPENGSAEGLSSGMSRTAKLFLAVTLHNVPEGMAVGVAFAGSLMGNVGISATAALALAIGIAIQNFPEGAIISLPMAAEGGRVRAFLFGFFSGAVEPVAAVVTVLFVAQLTSLLPYLLAFAAGAMFYVVVEELIPESQSDEHSNVGTVFSALGFALMMLLDVALG